eukprot:jgi/Tetstr1/439762/TSEL_028176.t1
MATSSSLDKTLAKLQASIASGAYYEAQQMLKTVHARHRNRKAYDASYRLAEEGARLQLSKGQLTCGIEMAKTLVETYIADAAPCTPENFDRLLSVFCAFPEPSSGAGQQAGADDRWPVQECVSFLMNGVKWLGRCGSPGQAPVLHGKAAEYIWSCMGVRGFGWATTHFIRADNKESFASALCACMEEGRPEEEDLFICRACLQTLAVATGESTERQLRGCEDLLIAMGMIRGGLPLPDTPLMHFTSFFIQALKRKSLPLEQMLTEKYRAVLSRDPLLASLITRIEQIYLGVRPPRAAGGLEGMLGGMMRSMFSGDLGAM